MIVIAAMIIVYGICCFGDMRRPAVIYFIAAVVNAGVYPIFDAIDPKDNKELVDLIYVYGATESALKMLVLLGLTQLKHRWLIVLLFLHIINDTLNSFHYGLVNDTIIMCELVCFIKGSKSVFVEIIDRILSRNLRHINIDRRDL